MPPWVTSLKRSATGFFQKRKVHLLICGGVIVVVAAIYLLRQDKEPSYMGVKASRWLYSLNVPHPRTDNLPYREAHNAFQGMGKEGALFLGRELLKEPNHLQKWAIAHQQNIPPYLMKLVYDPAKVSRPDIIFDLLTILGTNGAPAIPAVIDWYYQKGSFQLTCNRAYPLLQKNAMMLQLANSASALKKTPSSVNQTSPLTMPPPVIVYGKSITNITASATVSTNIIYAPISWEIRNMLLQCGADDPRIISLLLSLSKQTASPPGIPSKISPLLRSSVIKSRARLLRATQDPDLGIRNLAAHLLELDEQTQKKPAS